LFFADDVNLLVENINIMKKDTEALLDSIKELGMEENTEITHVSSQKCRTKL
jgi:hypothetical protein